MNPNTILAFGLGVVVANEEYRKVALKYSDKLVKAGVKQASTMIKDSGIDLNNVINLDKLK